MEEQQKKQEEQFVNQATAYETYGDYVDAWFHYVKNKHWRDRVKTSELVNYSKEQMMDLIDDLYNRQDETWDNFAELVRFYKKSISGSILTKPTSKDIVKKETTNNEEEDKPLFDRVMDFFKHRQ